MSEEEQNNNPEVVTEDMKSAWNEALGEQNASKEQADGQLAEGVEKAEVSELVGQVNDKNTDFSREENMKLILDIPVVMSIEVGKTEISIRNLLKLSQGSIVELDRYAGEPLDIYVNGTLVAKGEVVVVNEKFVIRVTDVISSAERIKNLGV